MILLIWLELQKMFKKWRTYIGFIAIGLLTVIVQLALYFTGQRMIDYQTQSIEQSFVMIGNLLNGYFIARLILSFLIIHIPFLVILVGADLLAGEATAGTYRMLLTRPVSRIQVVTAKFIAGWLYVVFLLAFLALLSVGVSLIIFGSGPLLSFGGGKIIIFAENDIIWRFLAVYAFAILSMSTVVSISIFFSAFVENAIGPIAASMALIIILLILSVIPVDFFQDIKPYFFTSHMTHWDGFFSDPVDYKDIFNSVFILLAHMVVLYGITAYIFIKKDVLS